CGCGSAVAAWVVGRGRPRLRRTPPRVASRRRRRGTRARRCRSRLRRSARSASAASSSARRTTARSLRRGTPSEGRLFKGAYSRRILLSKDFF
ncbi:hypothetical protein M885DRAFT_612755, partial [Pelagophyceae sp. CCMP2097]